MTYNDYHIEEYVQGLMPEELRTSFERELARNEGLRRSVEAERALMNAIRRDAGAPSASSMQLPPVLAAKLAVTPAAAGLATGGGVIAAIFGTKVGVTIVSLIGGLGILLGVFLVGPFFRSDEGEQGNPSNASYQDVHAVPPAAGIGDAPVKIPAAKEKGEERDEPANASASSSDRTTVRTTTNPTQVSSREAEEEQGKTTPTSPSATEPGKTKETSQQMLEALQKEEETRTTPRVRKETTDVGVKID